MSALLEVDQLEVNFGGRVSAVRGASVTVERGETHCLVGESGCGKSVTALAVMNLLARGARRSARRTPLRASRFMMASAVTDLPQPDSPTRQCVSPRSTVKDAPRTAEVRPNVTSSR